MTKEQNEHFNEALNLLNSVFSDLEQALEEGQEASRKLEAAIPAVPFCGLLEALSSLTQTLDCLAEVLQILETYEA